MSPAKVLPDANSPDLHLTRATEEEKVATWTLNSVAWGGALSRPVYLEREKYLTTVPLAKDGGITHWILVDKNLPPNQRPILGSCESLRKRALIAENGSIREVIAHGIGSVYCNPEYRGRGYASRMMRELVEILRTWQADTRPCGFSVLWSDIGKLFYAGHGWQPFPSTHIEFPPASNSTWSDRVTLLHDKELQQLCREDENMIRKSMTGAQDGKIHVCLIPDQDQMLWHHCREDFMTQQIFGKTPNFRGVLAGEPGQRIWAVFARTYYGPLEAASGNTLHILRLVIENEVAESNFSEKTGGILYDDGLLQRQADQLQAIIQVAQDEAVKWSLIHVELWNPTSLVQKLVQKMGIKHSRVEREKDSIASLKWYGKGSGKSDELEWVGNEKFGWC